MIEYDLTAVTTMAGLQSNIAAIDMDTPMQTLEASATEGTQTLASNMGDVCLMSSTISGMLEKAQFQLKESYTEIKESISSIGSEIQGKFAEATEGMSKLIDSVKETATLIKENIAQFLADIVSKGESFFVEAKAKAIELLDTMKSAMNSARDGIAGAIESATSAVSGLAKSLVASVNALTISKCPSASGSISDISSGSLSQIKNVCSAETDGDAVKSAFSNSIDSMKSMSSNLTENSPLVNSVFSVDLNAKLSSLNTWN